MENEKLCVECKWHLAETYGYGRTRHMCLRGMRTQKNVISGEVDTYGISSCHDERTNGNDVVCGYEGKYWEPKPVEKLVSWWERLIRHLAQRLGT